MTFDNDEQFVKNDKKVFNSNLLQIDDFLSFSYPEPRPIGEVLSMISGDSVLSGMNLNDEDDEAATLESIRSAESITGGRMNPIDVNKALFQEHGTKIQNMMETTSRISSDILENALKDKDAEQKIVHQRVEQERVY